MKHFKIPSRTEPLLLHRTSAVLNVNKMNADLVLCSESVCSFTKPEDTYWLQSQKPIVAPNPDPDESIPIFTSSFSTDSFLEISLSKLCVQFLSVH